MGRYEGNVLLPIAVKRDKLLQNDPLKFTKFSLNWKYLNALELLIVDGKAAKYVNF